MRRPAAAMTTLIFALGWLAAATPAAAEGGGDLASKLRLLLRAIAAKLAALDFDAYEWTEINPAASWAPRAGLESVALGKRLYVMGGRTPLDLPPPAPPFASLILRDVWASDDGGVSWQFLGEADWPERSFFEAVTKGRHMYVMGGQSFAPSVFYNDVWRSADGIHWERRTANAGWAGRAGLSAVVFRGWIYVFTGAEGDDEAIGGAGREFFTDVWKSRTGRHWIRVTDSAPWPGRGGGAAVVKNGWIYLIGGENGFLAPPLGDVWRSRDGAHWELVTAEAFTPRSGHKCGVLSNTIVCFGGFNPVANPTDVQISRNGADWRALDPSGSAAPPWLAASPEDIKFDFDIVVTRRRGRGAILSFGGDRETFDFPPGPPGPPGPPEPPGPPAFPQTAPSEAPPSDDLRVDNDVWRFAPPALFTGHPPERSDDD